MVAIVLFLITGSVTGLLAGLLGVGGGVVVVPSLAYIFNYMGMPHNAIMHMAASTSLAAMIFTTLMAVIAQQKRKMINWAVFRTLAPAIVIGTILGTSIASLLPSHVLKIIFGLFMFFIAVRMLLQKKQSEEMTRPLPHLYIQYGAGFAVGALSGMLGIGGGALTIPILLQFGLPAHQSAATSSACALLLSVIGTLSFMILGWYEPPATGVASYVNWTAAILIAITSMIFVPLGTRLAGRLSGHHLKQVFAVFLLLVGLDMLLR